MEWTGHAGHILSSFALFPVYGWRQVISMARWPNMVPSFADSSPFFFAPSVFLGTPLFLSVHPSAWLPAGCENFQRFQFLKQIRIDMQSAVRSLNVKSRFSGDISEMWTLYNLPRAKQPLKKKSACRNTGSLTLLRIHTTWTGLIAGPLNACTYMGTTACCRTGAPTQSSLGKCRGWLSFFTAPFTPAIGVVGWGKEGTDAHHPPGVCLSPFYGTGYSICLQPCTNITRGGCKLRIFKGQLRWAEFQATWLMLLEVAG